MFGLSNTNMCRFVRNTGIRQRARRHIHNLAKRRRDNNSHMISLILQSAQGHPISVLSSIDQNMHFAPLYIIQRVSKTLGQFRCELPTLNNEKRTYKYVSANTQLSRYARSPDLRLVRFSSVWSLKIP